MAGSRIRSIVSRQWEIVVALGSRRRGMTIQQLVDTLGSSRSTVYRDLRDLSAIGAPIRTERINGEVRYCLLGEPYPALRPTSMQIAALHLARRMMDALAGTRIVSELDTLLRRVSPAHAAPDEPPIEIGALGDQAPAGTAAHVRIIEAAITDGKRIRFHYHAVGKPPEPRRVDPVALRYNRGHLYLVAYDPARAGWRTFKLARVADVALLDEPADPHPEYDERELFAYSASVWSGDPVDVAVRLAPRVARFACEWPLSPAQRIEPQPDGAVVVHARVAGTVEAMRWVLRWGRDAEALAPPALREAVADELGEALDRYLSHRS